MNLWEIDHLVAEKVMGWIPQREIQDRILYVLQDGTHVALGWNPTVNIADAWQVMEKLKDLGFHINIETPPKVKSSSYWVCIKDVYSENTFASYGFTASTCYLFDSFKVYWS